MNRSEHGIRRIALVALAAGALVLAACGDDDGGNNSNQNSADGGVTADGYVPDPLGDPTEDEVTGSPDSASRVYLGVAGGEPTIVTVHESGMSGSIGKLFTRSGGTWTEDTDLPANDIGAFALTGTGTPHVLNAYLNTSTMKHIFEYARRDPSGWGEVIVDTEAVTAQRNYDMTVDSADQVHIAYADLNVVAGDDGRTGMKYAVSDATSFEVEVIEAPTDTVSTFGRSPRIQVDAGGNVHVVYGVSEVGSSDVGIRYALRSGGTWTTEDLTLSLADGSALHLLLDSTGAPHIFASQNLSKDGVYWFRKSGGTWQEEQEVRNYTYTFLDVKLDSRDMPTFLVERGYTELVFLRQSGSDWEENLVIDQVGVSSAALVLGAGDLPNIAAAVVGGPVRYVTY